MKKIGIIILFAYFAVSCGVSRKIQTGTINVPVITIDNFIGEWKYEYINPEDPEDNFRHYSFELRLEKDSIENALKGWHCSVVRGGWKCDCADEEPSLHGCLKNDTVYLHFVSAWMVEGEAKLYFTQNKSAIVWELGKYEKTPEGYECKGESMEHYMPSTDTLQRVGQYNWIDEAQIILPDKSKRINTKMVNQIQQMVDEINAMPLKCDTLQYRPGTWTLFESLYFDDKGCVRKYFWNDDCQDASYSNTTKSAYYNENGELIYISYGSGNNCEDATEWYYIRNGRIVDFKANLYCGCCEDTNDLLTVEEVNRRRPRIGSVLIKTIAWEAPLTDYINTHSLLRMLSHGREEL